MEEEIYKKVLNDFAIFPKRNTSPTFMEICQMGGDRFEERCSQIFKFYFNPNAPHELKGLFINSLLEIMQNDELNYCLQSVRVITEDTTNDNKRIDIIVETDSFVMAIENKIGAKLYNPLESYVEHINTKYKDQKSFFIILSARNINDISELRKIQALGYRYINYQQLFTVVKRNIGDYISNCNQSYLIFLMDFIRTIENKFYNTHMEMNRFFFNNRFQIEELINEYNAFKESILNIQRENISDILLIVNQKTNAVWWKYQGWDLGISFNDDGNRIGIESSYSDETFDNPLGDFHIYITVWKEKCFNPYEEELRGKFPDCFIDRTQGRVYLHLPVIKGNDHNVIAERLSEYYFYMKDLTSRIK